jgi:hypothetical protein
LQQHDHWFIDGTFAVAPELFYQVYTIHVLVDNSAVPLVYALLPDKTEATYERVFRKLVELRSALNPATIMADFERASLNACAAVFPAARLTGCLFHLGQSLWRRVQEEQLTATYRDDEDFRLNVKMLLALSFVPCPNVVGAFENLVATFDDIMTPMVDYWEDNYVGRMRRNRRGNPRFPIVLWNVYDRLADGLPRTNNSVKAWHRSFQRTIDCHHPSLFKLIEQFRKEQDHVEIQLDRYRAGARRNGAASRAKYVQVTRRLTTVASTFGTVPDVDYLRGIAHNLAL